MRIVGGEVLLLSSSPFNESALIHWLPRDRRRGLNFLGMVSSVLSANGWDKGAPFVTVVEDEEHHLLFRSATSIGDGPKQFIRADMVNPPGE